MRVFLLAATFLMLFTSCVRHRKMVNLKDVEGTFNLSTENRDILIQKGDFLDVKVSSFEPQSVAIFNKEYGSGNSNQLNDISIFLSSYIVSDSGYITLPVVGDVFVKGLTVDAIKDTLSNRISKYYKFSSVDVRLLSYRVSVLGEVKDPYTQRIFNQNVNVFQALGFAGGITSYGNRSKVKVIREKEDGVSEVHVLNLEDASVLQSPYFELKPNDVVYIEPLKAKAFDVNTKQWQLAISAATLVFVMLNFFSRQ